jgi:hypothetical protein
VLGELLGCPGLEDTAWRYRGSLLGLKAWWNLPLWVLNLFGTSDFYSFHSGTGMPVLRLSNGGISKAGNLLSHFTDLQVERILSQCGSDTESYPYFI